MPNINTVTLAGHLGRDSEIKYTPNGTAVMSFSLATSRKWKQGTETREDTTWHNVIVWSPPEWMAGALKKGAPVMVTGRISNRTYEKDGCKHYVTEIVADRVWALAGRVKGDVSAEAEAPSVGEDVPF
jgi:single-strand DNA-binding protein